MENLLTVKDIAAKRELSPDYVGNLTRMKGFPDPKLIIGNAKLFDADQVAAYFAAREKRTTA
jgi:hypothetical protein